MSKLMSLWGGAVRGHVADVCAGSGALGVELLSRGAKHVTFVDIQPRSVHENLRLLGVSPGVYQVIEHDARKKLPPWPYDEPLDVLITDPPYGVATVQTWANAWMHWIEPGHTVVCIEQESEHVCSHVEGLELFQEADYGRATWTLWKRPRSILC